MVESATNAAENLVVGKVTVYSFAAIPTRTSSETLSLRTGKMLKVKLCAYKVTRDGSLSNWDRVTPCFLMKRLTLV